MGLRHLIFVSALLQQPVTDHDRKPEALSEAGQWVWVDAGKAKNGVEPEPCYSGPGDPPCPDDHDQSETRPGGPDQAMNIQQHMAMKKAEEEEDAKEAAKEQRNADIRTMKSSIGLLKDAVENINAAYNQAGEAVTEVAGNEGAMDRLMASPAGETLKHEAGELEATKRELTNDLEENLEQEASFVQTGERAEPDPKAEVAELDDSFSGLGDLTGRLGQAEQLLERQLGAVPDAIVPAGPALKLPKSADELLAGPSSLLERGPIDREQLSEDLLQKQFDQADQAELKRSFKGLSAMREELQSKRSAVGASLEHLKSWTTKELSSHPEWSSAHAPSLPAASLVEHHARSRRVGQWVWKPDAAPVGAPPSELAALDKAFAPLQTITDEVKQDQAKMASELTDLASNMRSQD